MVTRPSIVEERDHSVVKDVEKTGKGGVAGAQEAITHILGKG
jgi:hypothetical protein